METFTNFQVTESKKKKETCSLGKKKNSSRIIRNLDNDTAPSLRQEIGSVFGRSHDILRQADQEDSDDEDYDRNDDDSVDGVLPL